MIRKATIDDKNDIIYLGKILNKNFEKVFDLEKMFQKEYNKIYLAEVENEVVGFLMAIVLYESCEILNIIVKEEQRKKGIASSLLDTLISELPDSVTFITLEVAIDNKKAIQLYKKFGLEIINTRKKYYGNKDAYLMGGKYERC